MTCTPCCLPHTQSLSVMRALVIACIIPKKIMF